MAGYARKKRFSTEEISFLQNLVVKRKSVIENKESDSVSVAQKKVVWGKIAEEFNAVPEHTKRTVVQLQKCWDNIKTRRKKELAGGKRARMATGGGGPPMPLLSFEGDEELTYLGKKGKMTGADNTADELRARNLKQQLRNLQQEKLFEVRMQELLIRKEIAEEDLKRARLETAHLERMHTLEERYLREKYGLKGVDNKL